MSIDLRSPTSELISPDLRDYSTTMKAARRIRWLYPSALICVSDASHPGSCKRTRAAHLVLSQQDLVGHAHFASLMVCSEPVAPPSTILMNTQASRMCKGSNVSEQFTPCFQALLKLETVWSNRETPEGHYGRIGEFGLGR